MAMVSTAQHRVNIQQVVSTRPTLSTVPTLRDQLQVLTPTRAVQQSRAVGRLGSRTPSTNITNITTILDHTVKGVLDILLDHTLTTVKVVMQCLQTPHTLLASLFTLAPRPRLGHTLVHIHPHSSSGSLASSLHKTTMEILSVHHIPQRGQGLELVLHHLTNPRTNSTNVPHKWDSNPGQPRPRIPPTENPQKSVPLPKCTTKRGEVSPILHEVSPRPLPLPQPRRQLPARLDLSP